MKWSHLCLPKESEGLGFQSFEGFNKTLVVKQEWKLLIVPLTLVARVLNWRYYHSSNVLDAHLDSNPSYI